MLYADELTTIRHVFKSISIFYSIPGDYLSLYRKININSTS